MALKKKTITKKKSVKKKTAASSKKASTDKNILDEIIRVDHAGEYGATRIYDGQIAIFGKDSKIGKTIQHMADQEQEHIDCLLYTSPSPRDGLLSRMPSSA